MKYGEIVTSSGPHKGGLLMEIVSSEVKINGTRTIGTYVTKWSLKRIGWSLIEVVSQNPWYKSTKQVVFKENRVLKSMV